MRPESDRPLLLASGCALAGLLSFSTLLVGDSDGPVGHLAENATWGFVIAAVVLALLAADGATGRPAKALIAIGVVAAAVRAALLFVPAG